MTASPTASSVAASVPISSMTPAASMPGMYGGGSFRSASALAPFRTKVSVGLTAAACTRIRTSPGPACTSGRSTTCSASGPPNSITPTPCMIPSLPLGVVRAVQSSRRRESHLAGSGSPPLPRRTTLGQPQFAQRRRRRRRGSSYLGERRGMSGCIVVSQPLCARRRVRAVRVHSEVVGPPTIRLRACPGSAAMADKSLVRHV